MKFSLTILALWLLWGPGQATALPDEALRSIGFEQRLQAQLPKELGFMDETGHAVELKDYLGQKPVILVLGYYECPMLCSLVLNGMVKSLSELSWSIGPDFTVLCVSIDPQESAALAAAKKHNYLQRYDRPGAGKGWHFLTGGAPAIRTLADAVGFHYAYDATTRQYAHPSGLVLLTPQGQVARYFFGAQFSARELDTALRQAAARQISAPVRNLLLLCFHYSPVTGRYSLSILKTIRFLGALTLLGLAGLIWTLIAREKKSRATPNSNAPPLIPSP